MSGNNNNNVAAVIMDSKVYQVLVTGDATSAIKELSNTQADVLNLRCEMDGNSVLHIAAGSSGNDELVKAIVSRWPKLMVTGNSKGDLPIHVALKSGQLSCVKALTDWLQQDNVADQVFGAQNKEEGSTPLHMALEYDHLETAKELVELYPRASYAMNQEKVCPLYLAIQKQLPDLVRHMLTQLRPLNIKNDTLASLSKGESILHAVVKQHTSDKISTVHKEILEELLRYDDEELLKLRDTQGWTALSFAACSSCLEMVRVFLQKAPHSEFISNKDGSFPIHVGVHGGNIEIIDSLCSSWSHLNAKYQNILHVASFIGSTRIVRHVLSKVVESLVNKKDEDGNTPLHLAVQEKRVEVAALLIQDPRVHIKLSNKKRLTANDLARNLVEEDEGVERLKLMLERASKRLKNYQIGSDLYNHLVQGRVAKVTEILRNDDVGFKDLISLEDGSNVLHFLACLDDPSPFIDLLSGQDCSALMEQANLNGDLPLHSAAMAGSLLRLNNLLRLLYNNNNNNGSIDNLFERQNKDKNTALHEAVLNNHYKIAQELYEKHQNAAYCLNKDNICPLFLAIKNWAASDLVRKMILQLQNINEHVQNRLSKDATLVVHIAIHANRTGILKLIMDNAPRLVESSFDNRGRSPLSYAAYIGYSEGVSLLLDHNPNLEFKRDNDMDGSFPIHHAAKGGNLRVFKKFKLSQIMVNNKRQNALHVAAAAGRAAVVSYLLKQPNFKRLINKGDGNGNTPLHLAVQGFQYGVVVHLTAEKHIDGNSTNKELLTPLDLLGTLPIMCFDKEDDAHALYVKRKDIRKRLGRIKGRKSNLPGEEDDKEAQVKKKARGSNSLSELLSGVSPPPGGNNNANILLVVAVLLIDLSYNSMLSPPGGNDDNGTPVLLSDNSISYRMFQISVYCGFGFALTAAMLLLSTAVLKMKSPTFINFGVNLLLFSFNALGMAAFIGQIAFEDLFAHNHSTIIKIYIAAGSIIIGLPFAIVFVIQTLKRIRDYLVSRGPTNPAILKQLETYKYST